MTHGVHSEAVRCDYNMGSELAYTYACCHLLGDRLATNDNQNEKTTLTHNEAGPHIGLQATLQIV